MFSPRNEQENLSLSALQKLAEAVTRIQGRSVQVSSRSTILQGNRGQRSPGRASAVPGSGLVASGRAVVFGTQRQADGGLGEAWGHEFIHDHGRRACGAAFRAGSSSRRRH